jgi:NodT family efflux transporter outer membrane factor (OMF) lipoprotein
MLPIGLERVLTMDVFRKVKLMKRKAIYPGVATLLGTTLLLGGCTPKKSSYKPPVAPQLAQADNWKTTPAGGEVSKPADDETLSHWWSVFGDSELTSLEERALKANLDLRTAQIAITQARANRETAVGSLLPSVSGSMSAGGSRSSSRDGGSAGHSNSAGLTASWEPDFFNGLHDNVASSDASIERAQENLRNTMVTLTAELAIDYVNLRSYQAQLDVSKSNLIKFRKTYEMTVIKRESGLASEVDVQSFRETISSTEAEIPSLETSIQKTRNAIAVLLNERPGALDAELTEVKPVPVVPAEVAVGIPGDMIRRRPDVRAAERQYAAQWYQVGAAKANLYPTFAISGAFSSTASNLLNLFTPASIGSSVMGSVQQTLLNRKALKAQLHIQNATLDQYEVTYQSTVLTAIQDVEDALQAFSAEQVRQKSLVEAADAAVQAADMSRSLYATGQKDFLTVLDSERSELSAQNSVVQSNANISEDLIRLYKAMGGGWK